MAKKNLQCHRHYTTRSFWYVVIFLPLLTDYLSVCIRQPLVSGLEKGSGHHIVGRKRKGGRLISFQWSHVAHFCLHGTHLHSKNEDGTWVHYPEIDDRRGLDLSHKCHVPDCVNKHHISFEPWWLNLARNCCRFAGRCLGDDVHPGADRCIFTAEAKRVVSSEVYPEVVTVSHVVLNVLILFLSPFLLVIIGGGPDQEEDPIRQLDNWLTTEEGPKFNDRSVLASHQERGEWRL